MRWMILSLGLCSLCPAVDAKPILTDSQKSYTAACLAREDPLRRLPGICSAALEEQGSSQAQRIDVTTVLADVLHELGETEQAVRLYGEIIFAAPNNTDARNGLAWIAWDGDDYARAAQLFSQSLKTNPTAEGLAGRASALRRGPGIEKDEFVAMIDAAIAISPQYTWAIREKGWGLISYGDHEAAEQAARAALEQDTGSLGSIYLLGYVLNQLGRWKEAYGFLSTAAGMKGASPAVFSQRALASLNLGYYKMSLKDAEHVIAEWPDDSTGHVRRARALNALGRRADAVEGLEAFLQRGHNSFVSYWLADLYYLDGKLDMAAKTLEQNFLQGEADYYDHELIALVRIELDQFETARPHIEAAQEMQPENSYPYFYEALVHLAVGAYDRADQVMLRSVQLGLPETSQRVYISELTGKGEFVRAIQMRLAFRGE